MINSVYFIGRELEILRIYVDLDKNIRIDLSKCIVHLKLETSTWNLIWWEYINASLEIVRVLIIRWKIDEPPGLW